VNEFAYMYDSCHVMLAPLRKNLFNECKSEIKVVEAGWKGKAVIASNIEPYKKFDNIILIDEHKGHKDWYKAIKFLVNNPDKVMMFQQNLHNEVKEKHNLKNNICTLKEIYQTMTS
jgi:glycosyltransferase involved in cell wall biosynthesis